MPSPIELLAPAGNAAAALAAFDAGADAVYAGLPKFNARERGENFTADELARLISYAHAHGKKVYVTMNTLIKEPELPEVVELLAELTRMEPDALIVQDLGVLRLARTYFPQLKLHASTQMGFHNRAGLEVARELGAGRVILERQVTLDELHKLTENPPVELEVFVHGALCCSLSGQCLFSSWMGGASGNRGKCKQPCRRRFYQAGGNGFFFSTGDLCTLELIPELKAMGIASLKIEGRLRQSDYVSNAVRAYRMMVDAPDAAAARERLGEARRILAETCGRRWTQGFYRRESAEQLIQHESLGAAGMLVGRVERVADNGFMFTAKRRIQLGDRLRVQPTSGDEGPALTLTKLFVNDRNATRVSPGENCFVCCDKPVPPGGLVFKLGVNLSVSTARLEQSAPPRRRLDLAVEVDAKRLRVKIRNAPAFPVWEHAWQLAKADRHGVTPEQIAEQFACSDRAPFDAGAIEVKIDAAFPLFLPAAELKAVRRRFWEEAVAVQLSPEMVNAPELEAMMRFRSDYLARRPTPTPPGLETVALRKRGDLPGNPKARRAVSILDFAKDTDEAILPEFCPEEKLDSLRKMIRAACDAGIRRFRITSLYGFALFRKHPEVTLVTGFPLPVANSEAALELARLGAAQVQADLEMEKSAMEALIAKSPLPVEIYRFGRPALLVTRAAVPAEGRITDARDAAFLVRGDKRTGLTRVYAETVLSVPRLPNSVDYYDLTQARWQEKSAGDFNFNAAWL